MRIRIPMYVSVPAIRKKKNGRCNSGTFQTVGNRPREMSSRQFRKADTLQEWNYGTRFGVASRRRVPSNLCD